MRKIIILLFMISIFAYPVSSEGFTVKSVSSFPIISNNDNVSGANVTIDIIANSGGQSVTGSWDSIGSLKLSHPFKLVLSDSKETFTYPIENQGVLHKYNSYYFDGDCPAAPAYCYPVADAENKKFIVSRIDQGSYGRFGNPDRASESNIFLSLNGTILHSKLGSGRTSNSLYLDDGQWIANIQQVGAAITGLSTPNQNNYIATKTSSIWNVTPYVDFVEYTKTLTETDIRLREYQENTELVLAWNGIKVYKNPSCIDLFCSNILKLINAHNANYEKLVSKNVKIDYGSPTSEPKTITGKGNIINIFDRRVAYDEFIITMRASRLGVIVPIGNPKILNIESPDCIGGDNNCYITVKIENIGDSHGTFGIIADNAAESRLNLKPGEIGTSRLYITNITEGKLYGIVEVYDLNSGNKDIKNFETIITPSKIYIPNQETVYNDVIFKSDSSGMKNNITQDCTTGIFQFTNGQYDCYALKNLNAPVAAIGQNGGDTTITASQEITTFDYLKIIAGILIIILLIIVAFKLPGGRSKKGYWGAALTLGASVAIIIFLLYYVPWPEIIKRLNNILFFI